MVLGTSVFSSVRDDGMETEASLYMSLQREVLIEAGDEPSTRSSSPGLYLSPPSPSQPVPRFPCYTFLRLSLDHVFYLNRISTQMFLHFLFDDLILWQFLKRILFVSTLWKRLDAGLRRGCTRFILSGNTIWIPEHQDSVTVRRIFFIVRILI